MKVVNERIAALRRLMQKKKIAIYYVPNEDDHLSQEYTATHFQCKSYLSGFTGESGCLIVTADFAGLWTDGRYFTQAENELKGTCVTLMRLHQEGVEDPLDYLIAHTPANGVLGFDGKVVSASVARMLQQALQKKGARLHMTDDLAGEIWGKDRPAMPLEPAWLLPAKYTGETARQRIARVRRAMKENHADALILTSLEDPCWMLNIRGNDIACTPIVYAFAMVTARQVLYYVDKKKITPNVAAYLKKNGVRVRGYDRLAHDLMRFREMTIWTNLSMLSAGLYAHIDPSNRILNQASPVEMFRAVKNATEIRCMHNAQRKDGAAVAQFLYWVKEHRADPQLTELSAAQYLDARRREQPGFVELSFPTISAYGANAAMMHYEATPEKFSKTKPRGFLLVDSGGTYMDGTTDITRTIALGPLTKEEKKYYTLVLKGHLNLMAARFLHGATGNNLDILARVPLWNIDLDYQCGTGHGIGYVLSVHEGPHGIRPGLPTARQAAVLQPGMVVTDEPGVYLPRQLGIRIENDLLVVKGKKNFYGQFLAFEALTLAPYEREAIDVSLLNEEELDVLNAYHAKVYAEIAPLVKGKVKSWLKGATAKIGR